MTPKRIFAGSRAKALRLRLELSQAAMADRVGISVSYLSQIESDDRPMTAAVLVAFSRAFPADWADIVSDDDANLLIDTVNAVRDVTIPGPELSDEEIQKALLRQPQLARRLVATHHAYRRSQEQLRSLDDAFDRQGAPSSTLPWEEVRDWFHAEGNYSDRIDRYAETMAAELRLHEGSWASTLAAMLRDRFGVTVRRLSSVSGVSTLRRFDAGTKVLDLNRSLAPESQLFLIAHQLVRLEMARVIDEEVAAAGLQSIEARKLLSVGLSNYAAGALLMPYSAFRLAARTLRHDVDALGHEFGVSFEQVCHRLSTLQRPGATGIPFFFCRVDLAGNITKRHSATRLQFARYGGACPLWIVHEAAAIPDRILVQLAETPDGEQYVSMAKGIVKTTDSYLKRSRRYAVALGCEVSNAASFIYADELDLSGQHSATKIGVSCRICPRDDCDQRAFPPTGRALKIDPDFRTVVPYGFE
ncbi:MAG: short-chain fatty acyl-CoA regulator family protein [Sphingomonadales bacterium]